MVITLLISIGVVTATDTVSNDVNGELHDITPIIESVQIQENEWNSIEKDTCVQKNKALKANNETYDVTTFTQLNNYLTSSDYDALTLNINSDINLEGNISVNNAIKFLSINGNNKKIDGQKEYQFLTINNTCITIDNIHVLNCNSTNGGAIEIYNSNLTITNTVLNNNTATLDGGVISAKCSNITIQNSLITYNNAKQFGGAIYTNESTITVMDSNFTHNMANGTNFESSGGAIYNNNNTYLRITNSTLEYNSASVYGGAIRGSKITVINTNLSNNTATRSSSFGGAIVGTSEITINNTNISGNKANYGGAVYGQYMSIIKIDNVNLNNNTATAYGGALYGEIITNMTVTNSNITYNSARINAGAIMGFGNLIIENSTLTHNNAADGGAICGSTNITISHTNLTHNKATRYGGSIYGNIVSNINIKHSNLTDNKANYGGSIYGHKNSNITLENSEFTHNTAISGGAIYGSQGMLRVTNTNLTYNNASTYGGAIYSNSTYKLVIINSSLNNSIASEGGAVYYNGTLMHIINSTLDNNVANMVGGAIKTTNATSLFSNVNFTNNTGKSGGAIYHDSKHNITIQESCFKDNYVTGDDAYVVDFKKSDYVKIIDNLFQNNTDNKRDMLFSNPHTTSIDIHNNMYIDNYLENRFVDNEGNLLNDSVTYIFSYEIYESSQLEIPVYLALRNVYNDSIRNGTLYLQYDANNKVTESNVVNNKTLLSIKHNDLKLYDNDLELNYTSLCKHYQNINSSSLKIILTEIPTNINIHPIEVVKLGENITIHGNITDKEGQAVANQEIKITVNNKQISITTDENGTFNKTIITDLLGTNNITITYSGDENRNGSSQVASFEVEKHDSIITVSSINTVNVGDNITITGNIVNELNNPIINENISIIINGEEEIVTTDNNGIFEYNYTTRIGGQHNLTVNFEGNNNTKGNTTNKTFEVNKIPTTTTANILNTTLGNVTIKVTVTNSTKNKVKHGNITILNNNVPITGLYEVKLVDGEVTIKIPSQTAGENITITVHYNENDIYNSSITTNDSEGKPLIITVQPHDSRLTANVINGTTPTVKINLTDDEGTPITDAPIIITDENGTIVINTTTEPDGTATIPVPLHTGNQNITVSYPGDKNHKSVNKTVPVTVEKHNTTLNVTLENGTVIVNASNENGTPIPGIQLNITDENGTVIANGTTDENGTATIPIPLHPGDYNITISTPGDENNTPTNTTITITIPPKDTSMTINVTNGTTPTVEIELIDDEGNPITDAPIIITDENNTIITNGTTGSDGTTTMPVALPTGEHNITVSYLGNETHKPVNQTVPVTVEKHNTTLNVTPENRTIIVNANNENGTPIPGIQLNITDENGTVIANGTTDENGTVLYRYH